MTVQIRIPYRTPFDWPALVSFLSRRTVTPVEVFDDGEYVREGVRIRHDPEERALMVELAGETTPSTAAIRARHLFDTDAEPRKIAAHLARDPLLRPILRRHRGIRVPGAWDPFEVVVRAIVGQQVSVAGATTTLRRIVADFGRFPTPAQLAQRTLSGMPGQRAETIRRLSAAIAAGDLALERGDSLEQSIRRLTSIKGIGAWTASYIAMRVLREPDAFPAGDLVLQKNAELKSEKEMLRVAEAWRPWRAYAAMLLWSR